MKWAEGRDRPKVPQLTNSKPPPWESSGITKVDYREESFQRQAHSEKQGLGTANSRRDENKTTGGIWRLWNIQLPPTLNTTPRKMDTNSHTRGLFTSPPITHHMSDFPWEITKHGRRQEKTAEETEQSSEAAWDMIIRRDIRQRMKINDWCAEGCNDKTHKNIWVM